MQKIRKLETTPRLWEMEAQGSEINLKAIREAKFKYM